MVNMHIMQSHMCTPSSQEPPPLSHTHPHRLPTATRIAAGTVPITPTTLAALQQLATNAPSSPPPLTPTPSTSTPTYSLATRLVHPKTSIQDPYSAAAPNVYQTSTFAQPSSTTFGDFDYSRSGNPTRTQLEEQMADIEVWVVFWWWCFGGGVCV